MNTLDRTFVPESKYMISFRKQHYSVEMIKELGQIIVFEDLDTGSLLYAPKGEIKALSNPSSQNWINLHGEALYTVKTDIIEAIISRTELVNRYAELDKNAVLISIYDPDKNPVQIDYFKDQLCVPFWDVITSTEINPVIDIDTATEIKEFILKHKTSKFVINCEAGMSRSAGVGFAVECLLKFEGSRYYFGTSNSKIRNFERYTPNLTVFEAIVDS